MNNEAQIKWAEQFLEEYEQILNTDDSAVFILNENNPMSEVMELIIKEQLQKNNFTIEIDTANNCTIKIIKGKENKENGISN